ncbi:MAG: hypothetical protein LH481_10955 [Burkholderiales bacterium]|nr:hypothetical protein [Burkholderiales bacterium]
MKFHALSFAIALISFPVFAQTPSNLSPPTMIAAPEKTPVVKHSCVKPGESPGRLATANQMKSFNADVKTYLDCLQAFVKSQGDVVKAQTELMKVQTEIGNNAVKEHNDYVAELSKKQEAELSKMEDAERNKKTDSELNKNKIQPTK